MANLMKWKLQVAALCDQAANGSISIADFYKQWPEELELTDIAKLIYEDIEDGVQHFPAKFFSRKPDYALWHASEAYRRILIDCEILKTELGESQLIQLRQKLLDVGK